MSMKVVTLGTSGSVPTLYRNLPATALIREGCIFLFDCGEGTQTQMMRAGLSMTRIKHIFISHLHGDHLTGIPGLLMSLGQASHQNPLCIYGPKGIEDYLLSVKRYLRFRSEYELKVKEVKEGKTLEVDKYQVECTALDHGIPTLGYAFIEKERPGRFFVEKADSLGVPEGPLYSRLQKGDDIKLDDGKVVRSRDVLGPPRKGRKFVYATDTIPCEQAIRISREADVLVHDGMFEHEKEAEANQKGHSTAFQAAWVAKEAHVKKLILTHISSQYKNDRVLLKEAQEVFPNTVVARDRMEFEILLDN
ncbi:ribonuclease Z [candidate division NPL-UPA2 bacterium Unc8]|uniref:Ribonuclease Z n=1 Tax=candidate division NPL-UPA2 bacterium Unc8 TaxID=1980939 RepID=A0A399FX49_UNCN2|nr:Ribonuclease Z [Bacillota bacterium]MBT9146920.1 Ribonuclease Z [Bacillota bacterium]RIH99791.1 MAG: ribonuclease Z [candidate division NPL-UPA2 bacterium Unc8]